MRKPGLARKSIRRLWSFFAGKFAAIGNSRPVCWVAKQRATRFVSRILYAVWRFLALWIWWPIKRAIRRVRAFLGRHEVWYWVVAWIGCGLLGAAIQVASPGKVAAGVLGPLILLICIRRLEFGIIGLMILVASFMHPSLMPKPITLGGQGFEPYELLLVVMLVVVFLRACLYRDTNVFSSPMTIPLILLCMAVLVAVAISSLKHVLEPTSWYTTFRWVYNHARPMFFYSLFFVVAFGLRTAKDVKFVFGALVIVTAIVGLLMAAQYIAGPGTRLFLVPERQEASLRVESLSAEAEDVTRSLPPGLFVMPFVFLGSMLMTLGGDKKHRILYGIGCVAIGAGLIFSFTRNLWLLVLLSMVITWLLSGGIARIQLAVVTILVVVVAILGSIAVAHLAPEAAGKEFNTALIKRFTSVFNTQEVMSSSSIRNRLSENSDAIRQIRESPILGIGVGSPLQWKQWTRPGTWTQVSYPVFVIHNSYLELWLVYGLLGVISFAWLSILFLVRSFILFRRLHDQFWKSLVLAMFSSFFVYLGTATVAMTHLHHVGAISVVVTMWGLVEVIWRLHANHELETDGSEEPVRSQSLQPRRVPFPRLPGRTQNA